MNISKETPPHRAEAGAGLSRMGQRLFRFIEFDEDEKMLAEIRKHPVGLVFVIVTGLFISLAVAAATTVLATHLDSLGLDLGDGTSLRNIIMAVGMLVGGFGVVVTIIAGILYASNVVFVTDQKIAEVIYISLFNRRIFQLGIGNVEDVTVSQRGILAHLFNYGGLVVETAGETANPAFTYVPHPHDYSQIIVQAHEEHVHKYGN